MSSTQSQAKILAQAIYEIRLLLSDFLGSENAGDSSVRQAAHLAYALHNEALAIIDGSTFDSEKSVDKIRAVDRMFDESFTSRFEPHLSRGAQTVDMMKRRSFADFLERLSAGTLDRSEWNQYAVNHYHDEILEEIRRNCVRLVIESGKPFPRTAEHRALLRAWASELRASATT